MVFGCGDIHQVLCQSHEHQKFGDDRGGQECGWQDKEGDRESIQRNYGFVWRVWQDEGQKVGAISR